MPRLEFSRKTRKQIIDRANGLCEVCKLPFKSGRVEVDHILPASLGGDNSPANGRALCVSCHRVKTDGDIKKTRKADRQRDKNSGAWLKPKQELKSRGFAKSPKQPKIDKQALARSAVKQSGGIAKQFKEVT